MIGKVIIGKSFGHCISYCLEDKRELSEEQKAQLSLQDGLKHQGRAEVLEYNLCFGDKRELTGQFQDVRKLNNRVEKPVIHLALRPAPGDQLDRHQWIAIGQAAAKEFGIDKNQYLSVLHRDTPQPHIHIVGNRVGYDSKVASDGKSYARMAAFCRRVEIEYSLKKVLSPRRFLSPEQRQIPRHNERKEHLKETIAKALAVSRVFPEFEKNVRASGYSVEKGRGIAFKDDKRVHVKGSEIGFSLTAIEKALNRNRLLQNEQSLSQLQGHFKKPDRSFGQSKENREEEERQEIYLGRRIGR